MNANNESPAALLRKRLDDAQRNERHLTVAETRYWLNQYKLLARAAVNLLTTAPGASESRGSVPDGWRQIETAPRNGESVIVACKSEHTHEWHVVEAWWATPYEGAPDKRCEWRYDGTHCMLDKSIHGIGASHWQPKPLHPEAAPTPPAVSNEEGAFTARVVEWKGIRFGVPAQIAKSFMEALEGTNGEPTAEQWKIAVKECPKDVHIAGNPKGWIVGRAHELARSAAAKENT